MSTRKSATNNGFLIFTDQLDILENIPDENIGKAIKLLLKNFESMEHISEDALTNTAYELIATNIRRYRQESELATAHGKLGGNPTLKGTLNPTLKQQDKTIQDNTIQDINIDLEPVICDEQANDKLASIDFMNSKDYQYIKAVYQQVYGLKLARLSSKQLLVVKSWFEIVDNPTKIQLVLEYYKNEYKWDGDKKPSANWIFNSSTNFINVYDDMVSKNASVFDVLERVS